MFDLLGKKLIQYIQNEKKKRKGWTDFSDVDINGTSIYPFDLYLSVISYRHAQFKLQVSKFWCMIEKEQFRRQLFGC